jgi:type II secretory pathway pseudopilin PulG
MRSMAARTASCEAVTRDPFMRRGEHGFTYIGLLIAVALISVGMAAIGELTSTAIKRDREQELLFAGDQIARAIESYLAATPGGARQSPRALEDLVADRRTLTTRRHLRQVYRDPMTNSKEWGIVAAPDGGIAGVYSRSTAAPLKVAGFTKDYTSFAGAKSYAAWRFVAKAAQTPAKPAPGTPPVFKPTVIGATPADPAKGAGEGAQQGGAAGTTNPQQPANAPSERGAER